MWNPRTNPRSFLFPFSLREGIECLRTQPKSTPPIFWVLGFMGELGWRVWQLRGKRDEDCLREDKAVFEMIKMKVPEGDRERRYLLRKEIHLEGWEALARGTLPSVGYWHHFLHLSA